MIVPEKYHSILGELHRSLPYLGNQFVCPCCGGHFRKFLPFGVKPRQNAQCPRCFSLERHRLLWLYLRDQTEIFSDRLSVLHFAPEYALNRIFSANSQLLYITGDLAAHSVAVRLDIMELPFKDNSFDALLCNHVLEHVEDDLKAMRELFRVLKPKGWAIIQTPIDRDRTQTFEDPSIVSPEDRERIFGQSDHLRMYGLDYPDRLEKCGFKVKIDTYVRKLEKEIIDKYALSTEEDIHFCRKT